MRKIAKLLRKGSADMLAFAYTSVFVCLLLVMLAATFQSTQAVQAFAKAVPAVSRAAAMLKDKNEALEKAKEVAGAAIDNKLVSKPSVSIHIKGGGKWKKGKLIEVTLKGKLNRLMIGPHRTIKKSYIVTIENGGPDMDMTSIPTNWNGAKLNSVNGTVIGPSGKETYYNMNMSGVVAIMRRMGNNDPYWVRSDGVKMLGNYVMVAAQLSLRPRGSYVPTSLGMGIVCDTGGFAASNPTQLDIATAWGPQA